MKNRAKALGLISLLALRILPASVAGQDATGPAPGTLVMPVQIPVFLAGNFGEPRINHFHSGIDIKTNGTTGIPVRAVNDGYVCRIKVEGGGYGHALYVRHPDGFTSLYGHLQAFSDEIADYVLAEEYRKESFAVDLFPDAGRFPVKKGQLIAYSGNTGSSGGPHLHFELRETQSENPVNPLVRSVNVADATAPQINRLWIYSLKKRPGWIKPLEVPLTRVSGEYRPAGDGPVALDELSGIGIETFDLLDGSSNHCGVYRIKAYLDGEPFYETCMDEFSFAETRYMNSVMDYAAYVDDGRTILKLFQDPGNQASIYRYVRNRGQIECEPDRDHDFRIEVEDVAGNRSVLRFTARVDPGRFVPDPGFIPVYSAYFNYGEANSFKTDKVEVDLPANALYDNIYFQYAEEPAPAGCFSPIQKIHREDVPVHLYFRLALDGSGVPAQLRNKAAIATIEGKGRFSWAGGSWQGNLLVARVRNFGNYCIVADTIRPEVLPRNFNSPGDLKSLDVFRFTVRDNLSGIRNYRGEIDGKWILLEYDPKNALLEYRYDKTRIAGGKTHDLKVTVTDQVGNSRTYRTTFYR